jgi:hypothetical protein
VCGAHGANWDHNSSQLRDLADGGRRNVWSLASLVTPRSEKGRAMLPSEDCTGSRGGTLAPRFSGVGESSFDLHGGVRVGNPAGRAMNWLVEIQMKAPQFL